MKTEQLSRRIGNIDERLIWEAEEIPNYRKCQRRAKIRRACSYAAMIFVVITCVTLGAMVFANDETAKIFADQEIVTLEHIGVTLILPESWKGRYAVEEVTYGKYEVYSTEVRKAYADAYGSDAAGGLLFYILRYDEQLTAEEVSDPSGDGPWNFAAHRYIMTTSEGTYLLYYASDVEFVPGTESEEIYYEMEREAHDIRFVIDPGKA